MSDNDLILGELQQASQVLELFLSDKSNINQIQRAATMMTEAVLKGNKLISCGNGGSFCDAMHFAEELTGRYRESREPIPAICISDPSHITCTANDFGYPEIFARYLKAVGNQGDVLLGISTSGNSENVIRAASVAKQRGIKVIILSGKTGGQLEGSADLLITVPHEGYADRIQEIHIKIIHILILLIEKKLKEKPAQGSQNLNNVELPL